MSPIDALVAQIPLIEEKLGYAFLDRELLFLAFVHRSFYNEYRSQIRAHNERLEFLGDSVLGLLISEYLYKTLPHEPEGTLSNLRSHIVEASSCSALLMELGVGEHVLLGKGERMNDGRGRETILADLFEALIGAIFLDGGIEAARSFLFTHFTSQIQAHLQKPVRNAKADLQDYSQKKFQKPPIYKILKEVGPDHSKMFHVIVAIDDKEIGEGMGSSKKEAEQAAAEDALKKLGERNG
ncbi:MAG: ribonuclease III [Verrucomicrobia bacterium]|nr:ribonuclease III [Verrucomicrobiota bacterium]